MSDSKNYIKKFAVVGVILAVVNNLIFNGSHAKNFIDRLAMTVMAIIVYSAIFAFIGFVWSKIKSKKEDTPENRPLDS